MSSAGSVWSPRWTPPAGKRGGGRGKGGKSWFGGDASPPDLKPWNGRSEEHTSELQSRSDLVCRLLLEKKILKTKPLEVRIPTVIRYTPSSTTVTPRLRLDCA